MMRFLAAVAAWLGFGAWATGLPAGETARPAVGAWQTETVVLDSGRPLRGLIESEDDTWLYLTEIHQGSPQLYLVIRPIERADIRSVDRLPPAERARLKERVEGWIHRARIEAVRMEAVPLTEAQRRGGTVQVYHGRWFDLESATDEPTTRRIIVRVEQMFAAYRQVLAPRCEPPSRLRVIVFGSMEDYTAELRRRGLAIRNPAVYLKRENLVLAGSDLRRYAAELAKARSQHDRILGELSDLERRLDRKLRELGVKLRKQGQPRTEIARILLQERRAAERTIDHKRQEIELLSRRNEAAFDDATRQMFRRLYHEAFHAYLENCVYPSTEYDVPVWLDEGLAMVVESGVLQSDTLRLGAPSTASLKLLRDEIRRGAYLSLADLLAAGPEKFLEEDAEHRDPDSARYYAYAWGLAHYLAFEKRLLSSPALDAYVAKGAKGLAPARRLERLVGEPLSRFQAEWQESMLKH